MIAGTCTLIYSKTVLLPQYNQIKSVPGYQAQTVCTGDTIHKTAPSSFEEVASLPNPQKKVKQDGEMEEYAPEKRTRKKSSEKEVKQR